MKVKPSVVSVLLATTVATGSTLSLAQGLVNPTNQIPGQSEAVGVTVDGTIAELSSSARCTADSTEGLAFHLDNIDTNGDLVDWTTESNGTEVTLPRTTAGQIQIDCLANAPTDKATTITFKTNNDFSESADPRAPQYGSWPIVIVPDFANQQMGGQENVNEARINGYLSNVNCAAGCSGVVASNLNSSTITADSGSAVHIEADIQGQIYAPAPAYGNVQSSPRSPEPQLYVIYDGASSSAIPFKDFYGATPLGEAAGTVLDQIPAP